MDSGFLDSVANIKLLTEYGRTDGHHPNITNAIRPKARLIYYGGQFWMLS